MTSWHGRTGLYDYDQRHRLRRMNRGTISGDPEPVLVSPIADADLAAAQDWTILDRRGNWNVFSETIGQAPTTTTQTRVPNGVNEYETIDPDGSGPLAPVSLQHDPAGNLTLDPTARNHDDPPGLGNETGQTYEYDEENRLTAVRRAFSIPGSGDPHRQAGALLLEVRYDALGRRVESIGYTGLSDPNAACPDGSGGGSGGGSPTPTSTHAADLASLTSYLLGPYNGMVPGSVGADADQDGDVDLQDVAAFARQFGG